MEKVKTYFGIGTVLGISGGYGLYRIIMFSLPNLKERFFFYFLVVIFITGISMPVYAILNRYIFMIKKIIPHIVVRESLATGCIIDILIWFKIGKAINSAVAALIIGGFVLIEMLLRAQETIEYQPGGEERKKGAKDEE